MKKDEKQITNKNFFDAWHNAFNGIIYATTTQRNIKIQLVIAVVVMIVSLFLKLTRAEFLCLTFSVVLIIITEMINTAIETVVDLYVDVYHPKAKIAKDVGAGAVVISAFNALIVGYFLFFERIETVGASVLQTVVDSPTHIAFVAIVLTIIGIISLKALSSKTSKTYLFKGGFIPSGQTAIAFAILTAIWLNTKNVVVFTLALVSSLIIAENRLKNSQRTIAEIIFGACTGVMIVLLVYGLTLLNINN